MGRDHFEYVCLDDRTILKDFRDVGLQVVDSTLFAQDGLWRTVLKIMINI
jgi:hypothetical protein